MNHYFRFRLLLHIQCRCLVGCPACLDDADDFLAFVNNTVGNQDEQNAVYRADGLPTLFAIVDCFLSGWPEDTRAGSSAINSLVWLLRSLRR